MNKKDQLQEFFAKGTPNQIGVAIDALATCLVARATEHRPHVQNGLHRRVPFGVDGANPDRVSIVIYPDGYERPLMEAKNGRFHGAAHAQIFSTPNGTVIRLDCPRGDCKSFWKQWQTIIEELQRLDFIDLEAPMTGNGTSAGARQVQLDGKYSCGATFYLDDTTAREAATWLSTNWVHHEKDAPGQWIWRPSYHMGRKYQVTPIEEVMDKQGRLLLTVGITEREASTPGTLSIPRTLGVVVNSNPRAIEVLVVPAGANRSQVIAACNALLLLDKFTDLLWSAKVAYGDRLRLIQPSYGIMDTSFPGINPGIDQYYRDLVERFRSVIAAIEPLFATHDPKREPEITHENGSAVNNSEETVTDAESVAAGTIRTTQVGKVTERHLRQQQTELEGRYDTLSKRIAALDTDLGRTLDSERKVTLQERRQELVAERERVAEDMVQTERQLGA